MNNRQQQSSPRPAAGAAAPKGAPGTPPDKPPTKKESASLVRTFAARYQVDPDKLLETLKDTAFKQPGKMKNDRWEPGPEVTNAQMMALLVVANEYRLNPFTREIYAFAARGGGIVPIVSIDGWIRIVNEHPELEYIEFFYPEGEVEREAYWVECEIKRKDRTRSLRIREYYDECYRDTDPWNLAGRRMNRHRAFIQCARIAFGYGGIYDQQEGERIRDAMAIDSTAEYITGKGGKQAVTEEPRARLEQQPSSTVQQQTTSTKEPAPASAGNGEPPRQASMLDTADPLTEIRRLLDVRGVPENELFGRFEIGGLEQLTKQQQAAAIIWLNSVNQP